MLATEDEAAAYARMIEETRKPKRPTRIVTYIVDPVTCARAMQ